MPCTQHDEQDQVHQVHRGSASNSTFNRTFAGLRLAAERQHQHQNPQQQHQHNHNNVPSFAIMNHQFHPHQAIYHNHYDQLNYQNDYHTNPPLPSRAIPRAILNVADDLTEQIRISVQDTHIGPRVHINEISTGGNLSEVLEHYENIEDYCPPPASVVIQEPTGQSPQDHVDYTHQGLSSASSSGDTDNLVNANNLNNAVSQINPPISANNQHYQMVVRDTNVHTPSALPDQSSQPSTNISSQTHQPTSSSRQYDVYFSQNSNNDHLRSAISTASIPTNSTQDRISYNMGHTSNGKQTTNSSTSTKSSIIKTNKISKIPIPRQFNRLTKKDEDFTDTTQVSGRKAQDCVTLTNVSSSKQLNETTKPTTQVDIINHESLSLFSLIPPYSNHKQAGFIKTDLFNGSSFSGFQKSKHESYEVNVKIQHVDFENSYLCGYLCINHLTKSHPSLTTFFEGEIISKRYPFLTRKWEATEAIDLDHWSKFEGFDSNLAKNFNRDSFNYNQLKESDYVFMRWKEHFLVPDHTIKHVEGASYAGFYYICYSKRSSHISGYYFHINSEHFER